MEKQFNPSADRNKEAICEVLKIYTQPSFNKVIEIGSGTGQHAVYICSQLKFLTWQPTDLRENLENIKQWISDSSITNIKDPIRLNVGKDDFPKGRFDIAFTSNTLHIMSWKQNKAYFKLLGKRLRSGSKAMFYGPFNYDGQFISDGNRHLDLILKEQNESSGIRNFEDICSNMFKNGFELCSDHNMPANNRLLVFTKS